VAVGVEWVAERDVVVGPAGAVAGLADVVTALRAELTAARDADLRFAVGDITVEFAVEATADATAKGGVRFWVVVLGGEGSVGRRASHRVALSLSPVTADGRRAEIRDID
jgi:hypothetical protein